MLMGFGSNVEVQLEPHIGSFLVVHLAHTHGLMVDRAVNLDWSYECPHSRMFVDISVLGGLNSSIRSRNF
jgi:hypothetical protein